MDARRPPGLGRAPGQLDVLSLRPHDTGKDNHPCAGAGRGLECDKLTARRPPSALFAGLIAKLLRRPGRPAGGRRSSTTHIDSWEVGSQNWTPRFRAGFPPPPGYDLPPFLPTITGRVVDSLEVSERFLWDLRQTVSDLLLENYAGQLAATLSNQQGLRVFHRGLRRRPLR